MTDVREQIVKRLFVIASKITPSAKRMALSIHQSERPAIVVNDGDEFSETEKGGTSPVRVTLRPAMMLFAADGDNPGTSINKLRAATLKAVLTDAELASIAGVNGAIKYTGCEVGIYRGETMEADVALNFEITYVLKPADL